MEEKICCLFEGESASDEMKERNLEVVERIDDSYRESRILYRCKKCGGLVLYDYEETAWFVPGEDWDNAYVDVYYYPVLEEDVRREDGAVNFNWKALKSRRNIEAHYRENDIGDIPYYYVNVEKSVNAAVCKEFSEESPVVVTFKSLPAEEDEVSDLRTFAELMQLDPKRGLEVELPNYDDPSAIKVAYRDGGYYLEFVFPMDDFGWDHPLVLARGGFSFEDIKSVLDGVLLEGTSTEEIPAVMKLKDITSTVYGDERK